MDMVVPFNGFVVVDDIFVVNFKTSLYIYTLVKSHCGCYIETSHLIDICAPHEVVNLSLKPLSFCPLNVAIIDTKGCFLLSFNHVIYELLFMLMIFVMSTVIFAPSLSTTTMIVFTFLTAYKPHFLILY